MTNNIARLSLGCSRFGAQAGAERPPLSEAQAFATVAMAVDAGVPFAETSALAGDAEIVLGRVAPSPGSLRLVVKTLPAAEGADAVERRARASLAKLGRSHAHALLLHGGGALLDPGGAAVWVRLQRLKAEGLYEAIGLCACACDDPLGLARRFRPDLMQLPASLLDQRLVADGVLEAIAAEGVRIQLRSVFLQGRLFQPSYQLPAEMAAAAPRLSRLRRVLAQAGADPLQAALGFALAQRCAEAVVVGVGSPSELRAVLAAAAAPSPTLDWSALAGESACSLARRGCHAA